jgi:hypothetical protein
MLAEIYKTLVSSEAATTSSAELLGFHPTYLTDRWLADCTLYGPAARVREGVEQWREAGITTPVLVPLSPRRQSDERAHGGLRRPRAVALAGLSVAVCVGC